MSLKEDTFMIRESNIQSDRQSRISCQLGHAGHAAESLVRARLSHRCLSSNKRGHIECVCVIPHETVRVYAIVAINFVRIFQ
jgi:hypothetical protein